MNSLMLTVMIQHMDLNNSFQNVNFVCRTCHDMHNHHMCKRISSFESMQFKYRLGNKFYSINPHGLHMSKSSNCNHCLSSTVSEFWHIWNSSCNSIMLLIQITSAQLFWLIRLS